MFNLERYLERIRSIESLLALRAIVLIRNFFSTCEGGDGMGGISISPFRRSQPKPRSFA